MRVALLLAGLLVAAATHATNPDWRITDAFRVQSQAVSLDLDPVGDDYEGTTALSIEVLEATAALELHWLDLAVNAIALTDATGVTRTLTATARDYDIWSLADGAPIVPGTYTLSLAFAGRYSSDALGLYKTRYDGRDYLFTQYETTYARRVFPLVDEPDTKIPWEVTLSAPEQFVVVANTPVVEESRSEGRVTRVFKRTPPMSSYLLALAVGEFDITPIAGLSVPGSIYSPKGTGDQTGFAIARTPEILDALEAYFGSKLPYEKLDFVAVPDFAFGAMENVGLVTYRTELLLRGDTASGAAAFSTVEVIAHELAHMWYGNLVTMSWWDDLWLNEAFATWMESKITTGLYPAYELDLSPPQLAAFPADSLGAAEPIRREVKTERDVLEGLGLNYTKGHAILNMLEQSMGEAGFQRGIRTYMAKHAWGNTQAADLWAALEAEAAFPVAEVAESFLDAAGFPLLTIAADGTVTQSRFRNLGAGLPEQSWTVPVSARVKRGEQLERLGFMVDGPTVAPEGLADADWVFPAEGGNGYFAWYTGAAAYQSLLDDVGLLSNREKVALLANGKLLLAGGVVSMGQHLALLEALLAQDNMKVARQSLEALRLIAGMYMGTELEPGLRGFVTRALAPWYQRLGFAASAEDSDSAVQFRARLLRTLAEYGDAPEVIERFAALADTYLTKPTAVEPGLGLEALRITALAKGDAKLARRYLDVYASSQNATQVAHLSRAMYFTDADAIRVTFKALAEGEIQPGQVDAVLAGLYYANTDHTLLYEQMAQYYDELIARLPRFAIIELPQITAASCSADNLRLQSAFYGERGADVTKSLAKDQERTRNCIDTAERGRESAAAFLVK